MSGFADKSDGSSSGEIDTLCDPDLKVILLGDRFHYALSVNAHMFDDND